MRPALRAARIVGRCGALMLAADAGWACSMRARFTAGACVGCSARRSPAFYRSSRGGACCRWFLGAFRSIPADGGPLQALRNQPQRLNAAGDASRKAATLTPATFPLLPLRREGVARF